MEKELAHKLHFCQRNREIVNVNSLLNIRLELNLL
jgi:hypothetical protein